MSKRSGIILSVITALSALYNAVLPIHPDEAYYWVWSRHLSLSYLDHPPMVAYLTKLVTFLGDHVFFIRLIAVLSTALTIYVGYLLAKKMFNQTVADRSLIVYLALPMIHPSFVVVTPDAPLILFWALTLFFFYRYTVEHHTSSIYLAELSAGAMMLSKYTGVLLFPALLIFLLHAGRYQFLTRIRLYVGILLALIVFSPVLIWNFNHDWASFVFQYSHGATGGGAFKFGNLMEFIGGQMAMFNPIFFLGMIYLLLKNISDHLTDERLQFLLWPFLFPLVFFGYFWSYKSGALNWAAPAYFTAAILVAYLIETFDAKLLYRSGLVLSIVLIGLVRVPEAFPFLPDNAVPKRKFMGYEPLYNQIEERVDTIELVFADSYQRASLAEYYLSGHPDSHIVTQTSPTHYDFFSQAMREKLESGAVEEAIFINNNRNPKRLPKYFRNVQFLGKIRSLGPYVDRTLYLYRCSNGTGG